MPYNDLTPSLGIGPIICGALGGRGVGAPFGHAHKVPRSHLQVANEARAGNEGNRHFPTMEIGQ